MSSAASENRPASVTATKVRTASRSTPTDPTGTTHGCGSPAGRLFAPPGRCWLGSGHDRQAVAGTAVRLALVGVRGQRVRIGVRVRRVSPDRDPGAARRAGRGVGPGRGRACGGSGGRGAAGD